MKKMDLFVPELIGLYDTIVEVDYKDEKYLVRDNGTIFRKIRVYKVVQLMVNGRFREKPPIDYRQLVKKKEDELDSKEVSQKPTSNSTLFLSH